MLYYGKQEFHFDREESSRECMWALEEYNLDVNGGAKGNMLHYGQREHEFKPGEVLHNFNGTDYKVPRYIPNTLIAVCLSLPAAIFGENATSLTASGADSMKNVTLDSHIMKAGD